MGHIPEKSKLDLLIRAGEMETYHFQFQDPALVGDSRQLGHQKASLPVILYTIDGSGRFCPTPPRLWAFHTLRDVSRAQCDIGAVLT